MKANLEKRICPFSGDEFVPKRNNQVFANRENRIAYNNKKNNDKRRRLAFVNKPLLRNNDILNQILGNEREKIVHKEFLRGAGFSFLVFTNFHRDENKNKLYYSIYHFYYYKVDNEHYKIVNNG